MMGFVTHSTLSTHTIFTQISEPIFHHFLGNIFFLNFNHWWNSSVDDSLFTIKGNRNVTDWHPDRGYAKSKKYSSDVYPRRVFNGGHRAGIFALLRLFKDDLDHMCRDVYGFKLYLHSPAELPEFAKHYFRVPIGQEILVSVKPLIVATTEDVRHFSPFRRGCYFEGERPLKFYRVYTQVNCEMECISNFTEKICGCVRYSLPSNKTILCWEPLYLSRLGTEFGYYVRLLLCTHKKIDIELWKKLYFLSILVMVIDYFAIEIVLSEELSHGWPIFSSSIC